MKTKKRFLGILLSLVLVFGLMPGMSLTAYAVSGNLWVGYVNVDVSQDASGTGWSYDHSTNTLTLDGYNISGDIEGDKSVDPTVIYYTPRDGTFNIVLKGTNQITQESSRTSWGIYSRSNFTISGDGTLNISTKDGAVRGAAIYSEKNLEITGGTINATSGSVSGDQQGYGIGGGNGSILTIGENAKVTLTGPKGGTNMKVVNSELGIGWTNTSGTEGKELIEASTSGQDLISYQKVQFPAKTVKATFVVKNGSWNDGEGEDATKDKTVILSGVENETLKLSAEEIPAVGSKPNDNYKEGSWDVTPDTETAIIQDTTYTYTYDVISSDTSSGKTNIEYKGRALDEEKASIENSKEEARAIVGEKENVAESDTVNLILKTDSIDENSLSGEEKEAADSLKAMAEKNGLTVGSFLDVTLLYEIRDANGNQKESKQLTETNSKLKVRFPIPSRLQKKERRFSILRFHDSEMSIVGYGSGESVEVELDKFSMYAIAYEDGAAPEEPETKTESKSESKSEYKPHTHEFAWDTVAATETTDGELRYQCKECGQILTRVPLSAYYVFNANTVEKITKAKQGETVKITTDRWISFHKMVFDALAARPDVSLEVSFLDGEYKGNRVSFTIPAGADTSDLFTEDNFAGFMYLGNKYGITAEEN